MLVELVVENYAVIERLRVRFHHGLNLLTGETGSGKSIVVDALGLLLGGRASSEMVRTGAETARVSGIFELPDRPALRSLLQSAGLEAEEGELLIEREISTNGKSRAFAASRPITVSLLKELAPFLADIHGQHDQQHLFDPAAQREMLDSFASSRDLLEPLGEVYRRLRDVEREIEDLEKNEQEKLRMLDMWSFQRKEIEAASPAPGEDAELDRERRVLQNLTKLQEAASAAYAALYDSPESALAQMRQALRRIDELARIDSHLEELKSSLQPAEIAVEEASRTLRDYLNRLEADPGRLEEIETRLALLDRLKRKYGGTLEGVLQYFADITRQISQVENAEEHRASLRKAGEKLAGEYGALAGKLTERRADAARKLEKRVESELASLAMERTVMKVVLSPAAWSEHGADDVAFLVSPNLGEDPRPIEKVASGGEISRIALALKTCLALNAAGRRATGDAAVPGTLVFDEVDAGVGGKAAETIGRRLKQLSAANQVLCVTHLPQIASFATHHFCVEKKESAGRTVATIEELTGDARVRELGRMLSGQRLTPEALRHAEQLIAMSAD